MVFIEKRVIFLSESLENLDFTALPYVRECGKTWFYDIFMINDRYFLRFQASWYIDFKICICYNCRRQKRLQVHVDKKE